MNEVFNLKRFGTYFLYDLRQMWRKHSRAAILIGFSSAIFYVIWVLCSLIFTRQWSAPIIETRYVLLIFAFTVLEFYQTRTYGYLTDPREGAAWLMVPASRTEKFVSMILMTLVAIPILFFVVFFALDGFLSLVDPTFGKSLFAGFISTSQDLYDGISTIGESSPVIFSTGAFVFLSIVSFFCNFLYFLLCGICFKRNKIVWAIAIIFGVSTLVSIIGGILVPLLVLHDFPVEMSDMEAARFLTGLMNGTEVFCCLLAVGLGWGIWRRIKTLQH